MSLHMDTTNAMMWDKSWIMSDKPTEEEQVLELEIYARSLPERTQGVNGARVWNLEVSGANRKFALADENVTKHANMQVTMDTIAKLGAAKRYYPPYKH